ncbi:MAG: hypothetical protein KKF46_07080 [Nanoarchaeota archaeon]|nr:hypothetical protein [Nanoarchaeota archaeon]
MVKKKSESPVFEIFVVLAIVAIVAITGQVLIHFDGRAGITYEGNDIAANAITGFAMAEDGVEEPESTYVDVGVVKINVNPPSPIIGSPFEVKITVANQGHTTLDTPFYVKAELIPNGENVKPTVVNSVVSQILEPDEEATVLFRIAAVTKEGPMKIIGTADSTLKLDDQNPSNDQRSKTIIITS